MYEGLFEVTVYAVMSYLSVQYSTELLLVLWNTFFKYILNQTFWRWYVKYGTMEPPWCILVLWMSCCRLPLSSLSRFFNLQGQKRSFLSSFWLSRHTCDLSCNYSFFAVGDISAICAVGKSHPFCRSICTTSWKRATLLFTCLPAMLHRGLIRGVDRSCNLKRGHCSSEQKQLKENERRPPRVKNRKLSTCMLESTTPHTTSRTSTPAPPSNLLGLHCYVWSDLPVLPLSSLSHFDLMKCNLEGNWVHHASRTMLPCCSKQEWHGTEALQRESLSFRSVCLTQN